MYSSWGWGEGVEEFAPFTFPFEPNQRARAAAVDRRAARLPAHSAMVRGEPVETMTVAQLRKACTKAGLDTRGPKAVLVARLEGFQSVPRGGDAPRGAKRRLDQISDDVRESISCQVCYNVIAPPVLQCSSGHVICGECVSRLEHKVCPSCATSLAAPIRNLAVERTAASLAVACAHDGCGAEMRYSDLAGHARKCAFRSFECPCNLDPSQPRCFWTGPLEAIVGHLTESDAHDGYYHFQLGERHAGDFSLAQDTNCYLEWNDVYQARDIAFVSVSLNTGVHRCVDDDPVDFAFYVLTQSEEEAARWRWRLRLFGPDGIETTIMRRCLFARCIDIGDIPPTCLAVSPKPSTFDLSRDAVDASRLPEAATGDEDHMLTRAESAPGSSFFYYELEFVRDNAPLPRNLDVAECESHVESSSSVDLLDDSGIPVRRLYPSGAEA